MTAEQGLDLKSNLIEAPGLAERTLIGPLAEVFDRLSPKDDGWDTEAFSEGASAQLYKLGDLLRVANPEESLFSAIAESSFESTVLRPADANLTLLGEGEFQVLDWNGSFASSAPLSLAEACGQFRSSFAPEEKLQLATKLYKIQLQLDDVAITNVLVEAAGKSSSGGRQQVNAEWRCEWKLNGGKPLLSKLELSRYQAVI